MRCPAISVSSVAAAPPPPPPAGGVSVDSLFAEDAHGHQGAFVECLRRQLVEESLDFLAELKAAGEPRHLHHLHPP